MIEGAGSSTLPAPLVVCSIEFQEDHHNRLSMPR